MCMCVCVRVCVYVCVCVHVRVYEKHYTWAPSRNLCYLSFVILLVDLPLCKRDFTGPTFVYKPSRNIIPALFQKIKIRALV